MFSSRPYTSQFNVFEIKGRQLKSYISKICSRDKVRQFVVLWLTTGGKEINKLSTFLYIKRCLSNGYFRLLYFIIFNYMVENDEMK